MSVSGTLLFHSQDVIYQKNTNQTEFNEEWNLASLGRNFKRVCY